MLNSSWHWGQFTNSALACEGCGDDSSSFLGSSVDAIDAATVGREEKQLIIISQDY